MSTTLNALAAGCAAALLLLACDEKKTDMPAPPTTATAAASSAAPKVEAPPATSSAPAASAAPMASASSSADAAPAGAVEMTLGDVKATKGKVDGQKPFRLNMPRLQRHCVFPAQKKDPAAIGNGSLKLTIEIDGEGKAKKITHATEGKVPDDVVKCIKTYIEKEIEFRNDDKATLEANLVFGPKK